MVYYLARLAGTSPVMALILSGIVPAAGIVYGILKNRHVSAIGLLVLAGIVAGTVLGLITHNPRLVLMEGSVLTLLLGISCLVSLLSGMPLKFRIVSETIGDGTPRASSCSGPGTSPGRLLFARITAVWGITYLAEAAFRVVILETFSTGPALTVLKVMPYLLTLILLSWDKQSIRRSPAFEDFLPAAASAAARPGTPGAAPRPGTPDPAARTERTRRPRPPRLGLCSGRSQRWPAGRPDLA